MTFAGNRETIETAVKQILIALGEDPARDGLAQTPARVAENLAQMCAGVGADALQCFAKTLPVENAVAQTVAVREIAFSSLCEHHLMPFYGTVAVAYLPRHRLAGLGSVAAAIEVLAAKPQLQERFNAELVDAVQQGLQTRGVLAVVTARHGCLSDRGAKAREATLTTVAASGELTSGELRAEALTLLGFSAGEATGGEKTTNKPLRELL
ncbi:GTP cyclohydrolase I FolE [Canibacter sp. lx-45]|uniref:GTP cyclohydrolase I n=1 Tax=Canibacter zhuwentaonis TaxID=2837491 RepID=UPI001BDD372D|nr:GTP cyclohydrolase I FolE [Canibacter zhuwentaonis]MBT1035536.1 GTP cyclohydrolase I FolE [Canibacter zhuwentaonis]